jgi:hypothetical protein
VFGGRFQTFAEHQPGRELVLVDAQVKKKKMGRQRKYNKTIHKQINDPFLFFQYQHDKKWSSSGIINTKNNKRNADIWQIPGALGS